MKNLTEIIEQISNEVYFSNISLKNGDFEDLKLKINQILTYEIEDIKNIITIRDSSKYGN